MLKLFAVLIAVAAIAVGVAMVVGGRVPVADGRPPVLQVASPADSFVVHDAPPAAAVPVVPAPDPAAPGALDAAIQKLRAAPPPDTPAPVPDTPLPVVQVPVPPPIVPAVPPPPPPVAWTAVTSQGARWRGGRDQLVIDMGGGRTATVLVDPAFMTLGQVEANARVDFLKQTILESFPPGAAQFRFSRDGSVSLLR